MFDAQPGEGRTILYGRKGVLRSQSLIEVKVWDPRSDATWVGSNISMSSGQEDMLIEVSMPLKAIGAAYMPVEEPAYARRGWIIPDAKRIASECNFIPEV